MSDRPARDRGWALQPDGLAHYFSGVAYPYCRAWFDWGTPRVPLASLPARTKVCRACVAEMAEHLAHLSKL